MDDDPLDQRLQLVISKRQIAALDDWRRGQTDIPSRSEAIRRLIDAGLTAASAPSTSGGLHAHAADPAKAAVQAAETAPPVRPKPKRAPKGG
jgi:hypothetical protein